MQNMLIYSFYQTHFSEYTYAIQVIQFKAKVWSVYEVAKMGDLDSTQLRPDFVVFLS